MYYSYASGPETINGRSGAILFIDNGVDNAIVPCVCLNLKDEICAVKDRAHYIPIGPQLEGSPSNMTFLVEMLMKYLGDSKNPAPKHLHMNSNGVAIKARIHDLGDDHIF